MISDINQKQFMFWQNIHLIYTHTKCNHKQKSNVHDAKLTETWICHRIFDLLLSRAQAIALRCCYTVFIYIYVFLQKSAKKFESVIWFKVKKKMNIKLKGAYSCHIDRYTVPRFFFHVSFSSVFARENDWHLLCTHSTYFQLVNYICVDEPMLRLLRCKLYTTFCFKFFFLFSGETREQRQYSSFFSSHTHVWKHQTETKMWPNFFVTLSQRCVRLLSSKKKNGKSKRERKRKKNNIESCTQLTVKLNCPYNVAAFYRHIVGP